MTRLRILVTALVAVSIGTPVCAQTPPNPIIAATAANNANITTNGQGKITAPALNATIASVIAALASVASIGTYSASGAFALNASAITPPPSLTLSGMALIPGGSNRICAAPGSILTLPSGVPSGTTEEVQDCTGGAATASIEVNPSTDATLAEQSPYPLTVPYQATGFRKAASGAWQPY